MTADPQSSGPESELLTAIAERYRAPLRSFFRKRVRDAHEAEDLVQEVFVRLAARGDSARIDNPAGYVFQTAANLLRDRARRGASRGAAMHELFEQTRDLVEELSPERVLLGKQRVEQLRRALAELPERTRAIFLLQRFEGYTYSDIAKRIGVSTSLVEKHMMDAIRHLHFRIGRDV